MKISIVVALFFTCFLYCQVSKVSSGKIEHFENFKSNFVDARNIDVWLPDGYSDKEKYAVLYMHDGQMLFDADITWNKQSWEVDEVAGKLITENKTQKFIVVGIWNNGEYRHSEYFPQRIIKDIPEPTKKILVEEQLKNKPQSDNYLKFLITEVKPFIDKTFATKTDRKNTFVAGSSMGGLISLYAICEYPKVFGGAACISTHTPMIMKEKLGAVADADIASKFRDYLKTQLPNPKNHKIYFDYGDKTLDSFYKPFQEKIDAIMIEKGFTSKNWITKFFPGKDHSENAWHERLHIPLEFLMKN
ncbi:alpha/beta hydrolase [Flavobacterium sp.]|jgi:enterochelin esterase-like enzyme|uniref:alpha/beta hydrolase n=1 Tax=Flavobacterium sp. TaxID=239 RepID=UPI0037C03EBE